MIACTDAEFLSQLVCTYLHHTTSRGFHDCDGILLFFKQAAFSTAVKWTARLKATKNYTPFKMGQTSTSASNRVEIVTSGVLKKELYSLMTICDNTEGVLSSSNCHLLIFKEDNKSDIIKQDL